MADVQNNEVLEAARFAKTSKARSLKVVSYTTRDLEYMTGIKRSTFDTWRFEGRGPRFIKVEGWKVVYPAPDFEEWWDKQRENGAA